MAYKDLREWIDKLEAAAELATVKSKVDWNLEIGGIVQEVFDHGGPALLFENIKDYENSLCRKLFTASLGTFSRIALMMGLAKDTPPLDIIRVHMERVKNPIKPMLASSAPVKQNILTGEQVNLFEFPAPKWHDRDGGRYIGTCDGVVTKDPETDWTNIGLYRRMIHDRNHTGLTIIHGQHNWLHWRKYKKLGKKTMPVAWVNGWDPVLPMIACAPFPAGVCEYDIMGALRQEPVELVKCQTVDLEVPASAEIVVEGEMSLDFDSFRHEGPFGEFLGYYASVGSRKPVVTVNCITSRHNPILQGTLEGVPINESDRMFSINFSSFFWERLNEHMLGVTAVYVHPSIESNIYVQIDNSYITQPQQAANVIWAQSPSFEVGKNVIVVDTDIDITDLNKIAWAIGTRVDPTRDIVPFPGAICVTDPVVHPKDRIGVPGQTTIRGTRLLIDATKYLGNPRSPEWFGEKFAPVCYPDDKTMELVRSRWPEYGIPLKKRQ